MTEKPKQISELEGYWRMKIEETQYKLEEGKIVTLTLSGKRINNLAPLWRLSGLKTLIVDGGEIRDLESLSTLSSLNKLNLYNCQISDLLPLSELTNLIILELAGNKIFDLNPLKNLSKLTTLNLTGNRIVDIDSLKNISSLSNLHLSGNMINDLEPLRSLSSLTKLSLNYNHISRVGDLSELSNLIELHLNSNQIQELKGLEGLSQLAELNLYRNQINDVGALNGLTNLKILSVVQNKISDITALNGLSNVEELYLGDNQISNLTSLGGLKKLHKLHVENNNISDISPLLGVKNLTTLSLYKNKITDTKSLKILQRMENLMELNIFDNPITHKLPKEELQQGWPALKKYLQASLSRSLVDINEVKVLFLGNTNVGKSTLLEYLEPSKEKKIYATFGIQYKRLTQFIPGVNIHVWDFGGQDYFHATHKLFFSPGALHVLMWNQNHEARDGEKGNQTYPLEYWLRCSEQLCLNEDYSVDILIAENKMDENSPQLSEQKSIGGKYKNLKLQFTAINLIPERRLEGFKELFKEHIHNLPILKQKRPAHYKNYLNIINNAKQEGKKFLLIDDFNPKNVDEWRQISTTLEVFHLMGILLYFPFIIRGKVFIDPTMLLDLLYESILNKKAEENKGKIEESDIEEALKIHPLELKMEEVIKLLQLFDLIFQIPEEDHWFAPQYLPEREQAWLDFISKYLFTFPNVRIDSDSYLMNVALLKLFTEYGKSVKRQPIKHSKDIEYLFWRDGLVIEKYGQVLMVKLDRTQQALLLYGDKEGKNLKLQKEIIDFIAFLGEQEDIRIIHQSKSESSIKKERIVPSFENFWDTDHFTINLASKEGEYVPWKLLQKSPSAIVQHDNKTFLLKDFKNFISRNDMSMKKIFISYSKSDLEMVDKFIDHLAALRNNGQVESWYCTELKAGEKWEDTIQSHFDEADIICFMVSPNFMKTNYIHQYEVPRAFERVKGSKPPLIVPIVLDFCDWETTNNNLSDYSGLPYTLKPIADFKNQNMAWYLVIEMLKVVIKDNKSAKDVDFTQRLPDKLKPLFKRIVAGKVDDNS